MARRGPIGKRTPERERIIIEGLRAGLTRNAAAGRAGVHLAQLTRWCENSAKFANECAVAESEAEARFTATIAQAAAPHDVTKTVTTTDKSGTTTKVEITREFDWRAAESWLKRRRKADWGDSIEHSGEIGLKAIAGVTENDL